MLTLLAAATLSCAGVPDLSPPSAGARFVHSGPGGVFIHETITGPSRSGEVEVQSIPWRTQAPPPAQMMAIAQEYTSFMGLIMTESEHGESYRRRSLPRDLLSRVNALEVGETVTFDVRHDARIDGESHRFTESHSITLIGCGRVDTPQGVQQTRQYSIDTAGLRSRGGRIGVARSQKRVDLAVGLGWVVYSGNDDGELRLADVTTGR